MATGDDDNGVDGDGVTGNEVDDDVDGATGDDNDDDNDGYNDNDGDGDGTGRNRIGNSFCIVWFCNVNLCPNRVNEWHGVDMRDTNKLLGR